MTAMAQVRGRGLQGRRRRLPRFATGVGAAACATKNSRRLLAQVAASDFANPEDLAVLAWLALGESLV